MSDSNLKHMIIYKITNKINNKSYVGQTTQKISERWRKHLKSTTKCTAMHNAIQKYGKESFTVEIVCTCISKEDLNEKESYYIKLFNTLSPHGYNLKEGGSTNFYSHEARLRMSESTKGEKAYWYGVRGKDNPNFGLKRSDETKKILSDLYKGKKLEEIYGEEKAKIMKEKQTKIRMKPVICLNTGIVYPSLKDAALFFETDPKSIRKVIKKERNDLRGLKFSYYKDITCQN